MTGELGERQREVLRAIILEYISKGDPVGSSYLVRRPEFDVSSATLRNVMADLEELGFLEKPHTSAGRVPTDLGYRFYIDTLLQLGEPAREEREMIQQGIAREAPVEDAFQEASKVLHFMTRHAGVVQTPRASAVVFHRIEFVRLRENRVLAILVSRDGHVQNKLLTLDFSMTNEELVHAANYLNELLREVPLEDLRARLQSELDQERALYDAMSAKALKLGFAAADIPRPDRVLIEGAGSLLETPEFADEENKLLELLDRVQRAREMQIYIGAESEFSSAGDVTVIASPYGSADQILGTVGVIGPTRMYYQRIIPLVKFTAEVLSGVLR